MIVASDKKVPNGMMSFLDFFLKITRKIAVNPPSNIPPKRATMTFGNPTIKPNHCGHLYISHPHAFFFKDKQGENGCECQEIQAQMHHR